MPGDPIHNDPSYTGPPSEYVPELGDSKAGSKSRVVRREGYHDEDLLRRNLESIILRSEALISACERRLRRDHTLRIEPGSKLADAQTQEWPTSLLADSGVPKQYVSYDEYKVMRAKPTRGADYIVKSYEEAVRGPNGSNMLDIIQGVEPLKHEAETIRDFLDKYIGEVNDSAEYRTLELLQDWTYTALKVTRNFRDRYKAATEGTSQIPDAEMARLKPEDAQEYQTLFKVKLNVVNNEIQQILKDFEKDYMKMSDVYFDRFLGPALQFRLKTGRGLELKQGKDSFLAQQALSATNALNISFEATLADQLRRNTVFTQKMDALFERLAARDTYAGMIKELEVKGRVVKNPFTKVSIPKEEVDAFAKELHVVSKKAEEKNIFKSSHLDLDDNDNPESHPWAINRFGDVLQGEFFFDVDAATPATTTNVGPDGEALPFDGMRPGGPTSHMHRGVDVDGTRQISGSESIEFGTLITPTIDDNEFVDTPMRLRVLDEDVCIDSGIPIVNTKIAWDCIPGEQYEIQVVPYCVPLPPDDCLRGHPLEYPPIPCSPWLTDRIFLESGSDAGRRGEEILSPDGDPQYDVTSTVHVPLDDEYFVVGYDSENSKDFMLALCKRDTLTLQWTKLTEITIASNESYAQRFVSGVQINESDVLIGCTNNDVPSVILVRANTATDTLSVISNAPLVLEGIQAHWGVPSIDVYSDGRYFVVGYGFDRNSEAENTSYAYVNIGSIERKPGGSTRDIVTISPNNAESLSSGLSDSYNVCVRMLNNNVGVVSWDETSEDLEWPFFRGYWGKAFGVQGTVFTGFTEDLYSLATFVSGDVSIASFDTDKFAVLYAQEALYYPNPDFLDVPTTNIFYDDIAWMAYNAITVGFEGNVFRPKMSLSRQAAAAFLRRLWVAAGADSLDPESFPDPGFTDVDEDHQFYDDISWMSYHEITTGFNDGTFRPENEVSRQAFSAFLHRLWGVMEQNEPSPISNPDFSDVPESHLFYEDIAWMAELEITTGYYDGTFKPTDTVTRQTAAAFLHRFWVALGLEQAASDCEGVVNPKTLRLEVFQVDSDSLDITEPFNETHIVDSSLNTNNPAMWLTRWSNKQLLAVWGSTYDAPNNEVTARGKAAILNYDDREDTGFIQETWDLPLNIPPQLPYASMTPTRMGDSSYFIVSSSGNIEFAPHKYDPDTDTLEFTQPGGVQYLKWPDVGSEVVVRPTNTTGTNDGSAVLLSDNRVMYVYKESKKIKVGYAPDLETFITENDSLEDVETLFDGLTSPHCVVFRNPSDGDIYLIWNCAAQDPNVELYGGANAITAQSPWQFIYKTSDEGNTWELHSILESPDMEGDGYTWSIPVSYNFGTDANDRVIGMPYISGDMWILPAPNHRSLNWESGGAESAVKSTRPAIWVSFDNGETFELAYQKPGHYPGEAYNGRVSRNIVSFEGNYWWFTDDESVVALSTDVHYSSNGEDWETGGRAIYAGGYSPRSPSFQVWPYENEDTLHIVRPGGIIGYYANTTDLIGDEDPFQSNSGYTELYNYNFGGGSGRDLIVQQLDDYYVIMEFGEVLAIEKVDTQFHDGVTAFIVDQCSDPQGPKT